MTHITGHSTLMIAKQVKLFEHRLILLKFPAGYEISMLSYLLYSLFKSFILENPFEILMVLNRITFPSNLKEIQSVRSFLKE